MQRQHGALVQRLDDRRSRDHDGLPHGGILFAFLIAAATLVRFALDRSDGHLRPLFAGSTLTLDHRPGSFLEQIIDTIV